MANYMTPGVYVEEIPKFPPSIAAVETAIPAFIGYTEKAIRNGVSLVNVPTRIESIAEYEMLFGGGPAQDVEIILDTNDKFVRATPKASFYLYDSLRMFYANGGGNCYILSVGSYPANSTVSSSTLEAAIDLLEREDEPTIILAPDVVSDANGPYEFQKKALAQCKKLMDRVTICDLKKGVDNSEFITAVSDFRNKVGINSLKYGAAYGPWLRANLPRSILRRNVSLKRDGVNSAIQLGSLSADSDIQSLISELLNVESFVDTAVSKSATLAVTAGATLEDRQKKLIDDYKATLSTATPADVATPLQALTTFMVDIVRAIKERYDAAPAPANSRFKLRDDIDKYIASSKIGDVLQALVNHHNYLSTLSTAADRINLFSSSLLTSPQTNLNTVAAFLVPTTPPAAANTFADLMTAAAVSATATATAAAYPSATVNTAKLRGDVALVPIWSAVKAAITFFHFMEATQKSYEKSLNDALLTSFGAYKDLVTKAADTLNLLPPSGAIAGIYAATDRERGVWKAPANVSLNAVIAPAVTITNEQQAEFNVDVNAGKSINIIRSFTGKGTLVWGARTLAGNDNEWRYVNVRRFFNMVEESTKKATEQFVFEPNDANTWVKMQAMIENFLTTLWRQGALQGMKPEHAFYVAIGLGKTMTPLDILEGRLIVEIGMAVVRPAEFIILKFSHKMAES